MVTDIRVRAPGRLPPGGDEDEGGGRGSRWRLLTVASGHYQAALLEGRLAAEGVEVFLDHSNRSHGAFLKPFGDPMAPVRVYVHEFDFMRASMVLQEVDHHAPNPEAAGPEGVRRIWWFTIASVLAAVLLAFLEIFDFAPCAIKVFCL